MNRISTQTGRTFSPVSPNIQATNSHKQSESAYSNKRSHARPVDWNRRIAALTCAIMLSVGGCVSGNAATKQTAQSVPATDESAQVETLAPDFSAAPENNPDNSEGERGNAGFAMSNSQTAVTVTPAPIAADLSDRDRDGTWDDASAIGIVCSGATATISSVGATCSDGIIAITREGTYVLNGSLSGCIVVNATKDDKVQLVLNGLNIISAGGPAIQVTQADKVFVTLAPNTQNTLSDGSAYDASLQDAANEPDACIFSKDDLTFNGTGTLTVSGNYLHGIVSKDTLAIVDATVTVDAKEDALKGTDAVYLAGDANVTLSAGGDTVHTKGDFVLESGKLSLLAGDDGVHADNNLTVSGGTLDVLASVEGLEALMLCITGGDVSIVSSDDGLNATSSAETTGAATEDSAADTAALPQSDATMPDPPDASSAPADMAAPQDPGAGRPPMGGGFFGDMGGTFAFVEGALISISGGTVTVAAGGDGLDSNGDLLISGGTTRISCTGQAGDSALDYNGGAAVTGGTVVAMGPADMAASFGNDSTQAVLSYTSDNVLSGGELYALLDASGAEVVSFTPDSGWQNVVVSAPGMAVGETYMLVNGDVTLCEVTLDTLLTVSGNAVNPSQGGGPRPNGKNGKRGGFAPAATPDAA